MFAEITEKYSDNYSTQKLNRELLNQAFSILRDLRVNR